MDWTDDCGSNWPKMISLSSARAGPSTPPRVSGRLLLQCLVATFAFTAATLAMSAYVLSSLATEEDQLPLTPVSTNTHAFNRDRNNPILTLDQSTPPSFPPHPPPPPLLPPQAHPPRAGDVGRGAHAQQAQAKKVVEKSGVEESRQSDETLSSSATASKAPILWLYHHSDTPLSHVTTVFNRLGYVRGGPGSDWSVLWSQAYPFSSLPPSSLTALKPHQKINHFPGSGCFTSKTSLTGAGFPFVPKAYQLPQQLQELEAEVKANPHKLWLQKSKQHRGIRLVDISSITSHKEKTMFVQEFLSNTLLIDGRKFDIGVYTAITSVDPLRVYIYEEEVLLRFCSEEYLPFNPRNTKQYVVDDEYTPTWKVPSMAAYTEDKGFSHKQALSAVLRGRGHDPRLLWEQVSSIITQVLLHCEPMLEKSISWHSTDTRHFFEMVRFDFVVDESLRVWLMEVNLSPNLSSAHTHGNRVMYEKVVYNLLSLVGLARATDTKYNGQYESVMMVSEQDIQAPITECLGQVCLDNCTAHSVCQLCKPCRSDSASFLLKTTYLEHVSRMSFHRVYPRPLPRPLPSSDIANKSTPTTAARSRWKWSRRQQTDPAVNHSTTTEKPLTDMSLANFLLAVWFEAKCRQDNNWCS